jgi:hypothetical protein
MNRSYNSDLHTYEARAAHRLQADILKQNYDLVLDMHTTTVTQAACCIVPSINEAIVAFLRATSIANIVVMQHDFVRHSLIGSVPRALSVEISEQQLCDHLYEQLAQAMQCYLEGNPAPARKYVFEVDSLLAKSDVGENATLQNFTRHAEGFYPVLVGEAAYRKYTNYLGFRARTKRQVTV